MLNASSKAIADLAAARRVPTCGFPEFVEAGGLMAYGVNFADMERRGAAYIDRILKGTRPGDLPVERATKAELIVNAKTAKTLGVTFPQSIVVRADRVIE